MIKYNNKTINDWYFDDKNIIKVYKNNAVCYYKIVSGGVTPSQEPCFAVVDNISSYQDREFVDVYDKATEKWYKLNNLSQYEQYGIYGEGRNITYYVGKLTIDEGYEYEWDGSQWVNLGEVTGSAKTILSPDYVENLSTSDGRIDLGVTLANNTIFRLKFQPTRVSGGEIFGEYNAPSDSNDYRVFWYNTTLYYDYGSNRINKGMDWNALYEFEVGNYYIKNLATSQNIISGTTQSGTATSHTRQISLFATTGDGERVYYFQVYNGGTLIRDFLPWTDGNGNYGLYDKVSDEVFYPVSTLTASSNVREIEVGSEVVYPKYYSEMEEPENNLTFATMEEALAYECPYVGMFATIAGELYKFNANNEWEKLNYTITGVTMASEAFKIKLNNADADATIFQDNGDGTYNFGVVYLGQITDTTSMASGNTNLVKLDFADADTSQLTTLGNYAFYGCTNLTTFEMPEGVTTISSYSFYNCNNYIDIKIPESITTIGSSAFYRSSSSTYRRVYITDLSKWCNIYIDGGSSNPLNNGNLYLNNSLVTTLTLPSDITKVKDYTFYGCKSIQTLNIPDNITSIGTNAFINNSNLSTINWGTGLTSIGSNAFYGTAIRSLIYPSGISSIPYQCFAYCNNLQTVTIPDSVTTIDGYAFNNCNITSLTLSQNLTTIDGYAFAYNRNLTTLSIPSKVTTIGGYAFAYNQSIRTLSLNQNLETISNGAFYQCYALQTVTIPDSVTTINNYAFQYCTGLTSITIEATTPPTLGTGAFNNTNDCPIYVPCASVNAYRTATNWSNYADRILGFESCTTYDWQTISGEYICKNGNKYEVEKYVRSFDNGTTWEDVTPSETRQGALIEEGSPDCASRLPNGYTEVEYIGNVTTGTNYYIDTQFKPNQNTKAIVVAKANNTKGNPRMFGSGPWDGLAFVANIEQGSTDKYYFKFGNTSGWYQTSVVADTNKHTFDLSKNGYYIDGVLAGTPTTSTFQLTTNLGLFNAPSIRNFMAGETFRGNIYSCQIYDNDVLIRDLVPCVRDSDSKSGMYDLVNDVFYTAVNTNYNFVVGDPV